MKRIFNCVSKFLKFKSSLMLSFLLVQCAHVSDMEMLAKNNADEKGRRFEQDEEKKKFDKI